MTLAISLRQPWAFAVLHLGKSIENRNWPSNYRGPLLIHASKTINHHEYTSAVWWMAERGLAHTRGLPSSEEVQKGGIIGICRMVDCVRKSDSRWFEGPYGFVLEGARPVDFFPCPGRLGLFEVAWPPVRKTVEEKGALL